MTRIICLTVILIFDFVRKVNCLNFNDMLSRPMRQTKTFNTNFDNWYIGPVSNVEFCMHRIQFTLDSTAIVKFDVCFKRSKTHGIKCRTKYNTMV